MVSKGVRLNDFSIVERSNRYFDHPNTISSTPSSVAIDTEDVKLSPALMHTQWGVSMWLVACTSVGMATFFLLDQIVTLSLAGRIVRKYLLKKD